MHPPPELREILPKAADGTIRHPDFARLIQICRVIAESYLIHHRSSILRVISFHGITLSDLANDCIGEIFARNEDGQFIRLGKFVSSLSHSIKEMQDLDLFIMFRKFVSKVANAQLAKTYAQCDPAGAKIYRNLKDGMKSFSSHVKLTEDFRGKVLQPKNCDLLDHLPPYPIDQLEQELRDGGMLVRATPVLLKMLAHVLKEQETFRRSIPLFDIVRLIRNAYAQNTSDEQERYDRIDIPSLTEEELQNLRGHVIQAINEKIVVSYFLKKKISDVESRQLSSILTNIIDGWFDGEKDSDSFYQHAAAVAGVSKEQYEFHWRKRIEYLARFARETITTNLQDEL